MAVTFPNSPTLNQTYTAENGLIYVWDGEKWKMYSDPSTSQSSLWARDAANVDVYPATAGDNVNVRDGGGTITATLNSDGSVDFITLNIEALPALP